ncbi:replicative DNA helicase [Clostridium botulinum]|uniref:Replicative DNA helicase n=1 Tax=Clostridium botulinum TaxID=1491 RepID=A0A846JBD9_CLOBO|nr:replicative DNA helicase [Clostridium botulinum]ACA57534.1 replicative DNA helicase [Clostridium botulinum A3 str. Loch Maree]NFH65490.1 replicative DNA helicase [Clostridium botulinum]NFJ09347.1 replicative DNA helicase [Clostridium botulinum]NFK16618.1 replicative DNA helicase [Clostridium botulinum]NFM94343.1 replicative DNA helicase [Clostridium botulinum]
MVANQYDLSYIKMEAELLAILLSDNNAIIDLVDADIKSEDFLLPKHQILFDAMNNLYIQNAPITITTLSEYLQKNDDLIDAGGVSYLAQLFSAGYSNSNISYYSEKIKKHALKREYYKNLISTKNKLEQSKNVDIIKELEEMQNNIYSLLPNTSNKEESMLEVLDNITNDLSNRYAGNGPNVAIVIDLLKDYIQGLYKQDLMIIAARPSMGKTALVLNIAKELIFTKNKNVGIFSLEMSKEQLVTRILCSMARISLNEINPEMDNKKWINISNTMNIIYSKRDNMHIFDKSKSLNTIISDCKRLKMQNKLDLIIIDYLQLIMVTKKFNSQNEEKGYISNCLKGLSKELDVPIICLSQLSRAPETRADKRPVLSDLRDSGSIEQDADIIMFIYRDEYYNPETEDKGIAECIVGKQRNGPTGTMKLSWCGENQTFAKLDMIHRQ